MPVRLPSDNEPIADINITPFVDIVLVLLVIFMVTAQLMVGKGINVDLPTAKSSEVIQQQNNITIAILKNSSYIIDGKTMSLTQIQSFINSKFQNKNLVSVTISADKSVPYNSLVQLMDALRLQGVSNFALQMNPAP